MLFSKVLNLLEGEYVTVEFSDRKISGEFHCLSENFYSVYNIKSSTSFIGDDISEIKIMDDRITLIGV